MIPFHRELSDTTFGLIVKRIEGVVHELLDDMPLVEGGAYSRNIYGEEQKRLDVLSNEMIVSALKGATGIGYLASEELDEPLRVDEQGYFVAFDPLDGSSNIESNNLMGSIFGIYASRGVPASCSTLVASFYTLYGPTVRMIFAHEGSVSECVMIKKGELKDNFVKTRVMKIPEKLGVYGIGGSRKSWPAGLDALEHELELAGSKLRYGGSLVGDFNQVLHNGGLFAYPGTRERPLGKLRLLYEVAPISLVAEFAGGAATDGKARILEKALKSHTDTSPLFAGSRAAVARVSELIQ